MQMEGTFIDIKIKTTITCLANEDSLFGVGIASGVSSSSPSVLIPPTATKRHCLGTGAYCTLPF